MSSTRQAVTVQIFFLLSRLGGTKLTALYLDKILESNVSLSQLKRAMAMAENINNADLIDKLCEKAITAYPKNSFGYVSKAKHCFEKGDVESAQKFLKAAPKSAAIIRAQSLYVAVRKAVKYASISLADEVDKAGSDEALLDAIEQRAKAEILSCPDNPGAYNVLLKIQKKQGRYLDVVETIGQMPTNLAGTLGNRLLHSEALRKIGDQSAAFDVLLRSQIEHPSDRRILMGISDLLRDDPKPTAAYTYIRAAQVCYPEYGAVRQLSFEIDHNQLSDAKKSLSAILSFDPITLLKFLPMINRATPFFPEMADQIKEARIRAKMVLDAEKGKKGINPNDQVRVAVKCRWLEEAKRVVDRSARGTQRVSAERATWLESVINNIGENRLLFDIASFNEESDTFLALHKNNAVPLDSVPESATVIELFIPTVFFADPEQEKPSYATVREFLSAVYSYLRKTTDHAIVVRHQWNWRNCDPRVPGAYVISYHTSSAITSDKHLHIQETPLSGRCSIDRKGFAGYSSIACDYEEIHRSTENVSDGELKLNLRELRERYVTQNVSKYAQTGQRVSFAGDYVFVALQIPTDIVASLANITGVDLVTTVANHYANSGIKVIVKRHPYCNSMSVQKCLNELEAQGKVEISTASVHDLIAGAQVVFTVNSGVGLEALIHLKPVIVTGACDYAFATVAKPEDTSQLLEVLKQPPVIHEENIMKFLYFYTKYYSVHSADSQTINSMLLQHLQQQDLAGVEP